MNNKKRVKFIQLAEKRMNDAIKKLQLLGNLSNKNNYEYTDDEVKQMLDTLKFEVELLEEKYKEGEINTVEFKFK